MQNQDPTADTDPNEYINQLVNVNSLEQLIDINQNLSTALGNSSTSSSSSAGAQSHSSAASRASGNLSVPSASSAAHRVAHALDGRTHAQTTSEAPTANASGL
jgi:flagellar basal-body rod modification protein FlgD